eukprot:jgi/Mesvir1/26434/Mv16121-RA.2
MRNTLSTTGVSRSLNDWVVTNPGDNACNVGFTGVTCNGANTRVIAVVLTDEGLDGTIPRSVGSLNALISLTLTDNVLTGTLPSTLSSLTSLVTLAVGTNQISGTIPPGLGSLSALEYIDCAFNALTGTVPGELGRCGYMEEMYFNDNQLSGIISSELGSLSNVNTINLSNNQLSGTIPSALAFPPALQCLNFYNNQLCGSIPPEFAGQTVTVSVANNALICGPDPPSLTTVRGNNYPSLTCPVCIDTASGLDRDWNCPANKPICVENSACDYVNPTCALLPSSEGASCPSTGSAVQVIAQVSVKDCIVTATDPAKLADAVALYVSFLRRCGFSVSTDGEAATRRHLMQGVAEVVVAITMFVDDEREGHRVIDLVSSPGFKDLLATFFNTNVGAVQTVTILEAVYLILSSATSDPHFTTARGDKFDFNGEVGKTYCIVTDEALQVNARFTGAVGTDAAAMPATSSSPISSQTDARTWMDQIGIRFGGDQVLVDAQSPPGIGATAAYGSLLVNGERHYGQRAIQSLPSGMTISRKKTRVLVNVPNVAAIEVEVVRASSWESGKGPGKNFLNLKLMEFQPTSAVHGILGQSALNASAALITGSPVDYQTTGIFGTDCQFNQFVSQE